MVVAEAVGCGVGGESDRRVMPSLVSRGVLEMPEFSEGGRPPFIYFLRSALAPAKPAAPGQ